ncbi:MAG: hypothetical protein KA841_05680 [Chitinophagales bacterium]|nr:hypothetical protein [Chitinophagales bacterium]
MMDFIKTYPYATLVGIVTILLIAFLIYRNYKDEQEFEHNENITGHEHYESHHKDNQI